MHRPDQSKVKALLAHVVPELPAPLNPEDAERAYIARQLVICTFPHSDPGPVDAWVREAGNLKLVMTRTQIDRAGRLVGYPYGSLPRLILFWLNTEAVRGGTRKINLGATLSAFMRDLGLDPRNGTGPRSDSTRLKNQLTRLFAASITFQQFGDVHTPNKFINMTIAQEGALWWEPQAPEQGQLWGSWVLLGERFFEMLTNAPVPVDMRILREIKASPLALDLYAWLTYTVFRVSRSSQPVLFVPWAALASQLGAGYTDAREFGRKARTALRRIAAMYPGACIQIVAGGVRIKATSVPSVLPVGCGNVAVR